MERNYGRSELARADLICRVSLKEIDHMSLRAESIKELTKVGTTQTTN